MTWRKRSLAFAGLLTACAASFFGGVVAGERRAQSSSEWVEGRLISTAIESVRANALDTMPSDELIKRAVAGMLRELHDPYAAMLRTDGFEQYKGSLQGDGRGLGLAMRRQAGAITVARVYRGSPAWTHGIRPGDRIVGVNGMVADSVWTRRNAADALTDTTRFQLLRAPYGDTLQIAVVRKNWHMPAVRDAGLVADSVGYVHLTSISARSTEELEEAIEELENNGAKSLILDLRGNNGGLFEEGVRIASLFLPRGTLVASVVGRAGAQPTLHHARGSRWTDMPVTVLVDAQTASAAELVAAALRDQKRALLVGSNTYGKGFVQRVVRLSPDIALRLTTARWLPPGGAHIARRETKGNTVSGGLTPDVLVEDASRYDPFSIPPHLGPKIVSRLTSEADTIAIQALREKWASTPSTSLESRIATRAAARAPSQGVKGIDRAMWVGTTTRLATVRVLEANSDTDALLRYQAREDGVLRAGLEVVAPGAQSIAFPAAQLRQLRAAPGAVSAGSSN